MKKKQFNYEKALFIMELTFLSLLIVACIGVVAFAGLSITLNITLCLITATFVAYMGREVKQGIWGDKKGEAHEL